MADSSIAVDGSGAEKLQTYENTVGADSVHSEAVTPTFSDGTPAIATETPDSMTATTAAAVDAFTPTASKKLRIKHYHLLIDPDAASSVLVTVRWKTSGIVIFNGKLSQYGGTYATTIHGILQGDTDEVIEIELDAAVSVYFNIRYEEVD